MGKMISIIAVAECSAAHNQPIKLVHHVSKENICSFSANSDFRFPNRYSMLINLIPLVMSMAGCLNRNLAMHS